MYSSLEGLVTIFFSRSFFTFVLQISFLKLMNPGDYLSALFVGGCVLCWTVLVNIFVIIPVPILELALRSLAIIPAIYGLVLSIKVDRSMSAMRSSLLIGFPGIIVWIISQIISSCDQFLHPTQWMAILCGSLFLHIIGGTLILVGGFRFTDPLGSSPPYGREYKAFVMSCFTIFFALSIVTNIINALSAKILNEYVSIAVVMIAAFTGVPMIVGLVMGVLRYIRESRAASEVVVKEP